MTAEPERLNQEGFAAFVARTEEPSPVAMLNLLLHPLDYSGF